VLVHLLDLSAQEDGRTPWGDFGAINHELACFRPDLAERPQIVVASKMDLPDARQCLPEMQRQFAAQGLDVIPISAVTGAGLDELVYRLAAELKAAPPVAAERNVT
jgi:GTP-binding protein